MDFIDDTNLDKIKKNTLKMVIREWLTSKEPMSVLLSKYFTAQSEHRLFETTPVDYFQILISEEKFSPKRARCLLAAAEKYGSCEVSISYVSDYQYELEQGKIAIVVYYLPKKTAIPFEERWFLESLVRSVEKNLSRRKKGFADLVDLAKLIQENIGVSSGIKVVASKDGDYQLNIRCDEMYAERRTLDFLLRDFKSSQKQKGVWRFETSSQLEFDSMLKKILNKIEG